MVNTIISKRGHDFHLQYIAKNARGRVQTHRANLSVVPIPQWWYRLLKKMGREKELKYEYVDYDNCSDDLLYDTHYSDAMEYIQSKLNKTQINIIQAKICGFTDEEIAESLNVSRQYITAEKTRMMEKLRRVLKEMRDEERGTMMPVGNIADGGGGCL